MYILGISAFYHDSAAAILKQGKVICALEEERFSRIKHDNSFPLASINRCLKTAGITIDQVGAIAYYEKPLLKFERILTEITKNYPYSMKLFTTAIPEWLGQKIKVGSIIKNKLNFKKDIYYIPHHLSHAAAAFYPSQFKTAAVLTIDGVGEYQTTGLWFAQDNEIKLLKSLNFPHSVGLLYSLFTSFLGFRVNEDEYKLMGLSAYGTPSHIEKIFQIIDLKGDGSFQIKEGYFNFENHLSPWTNKFTKLFGPEKKPSQPFEKRHKDLAASIQAVTEQILFKILHHLYELTKSPNLCIGGGVGLNSLANGKIHLNTPFQKSYVFGTAGDSGGALGAALFTDRSILNSSSDSLLSDLKIGTAYSPAEIENEVKNFSFPYTLYKSSDQMTSAAAKLLAKGEVVGWFQGKMEFGPRALGARSILANPQDAGMKTKVNDIKKREQYRPFAGSVLQEKVQQLFEVPTTNYPYPFMTYCFKVKPSQKPNLAAITHQDNTCRIQTVSRKNDGIYYQLISKFYRLTGTPCVLNTSFNLAGEPIVETPLQAIGDFKKSKLKHLVIGNFILTKKQNPKKP